MSKITAYKLPEMAPLILAAAEERRRLAYESPFANGEDPFCQADRTPATDALAQAAGELQAELDEGITKVFNVHWLDTGGFSHETLNLRAGNQAEAQMSVINWAGELFDQITYIEEVK